MGEVVETAAGTCLGGPGAIATTPPGFEEAAPTAPFGAVADVEDFGDSESVGCFGGIADTGVAREFFREFFFERVPVPAEDVLPLPRLRFLITSVLSESGRTTP